MKIKLEDIDLCTEYSTREELCEDTIDEYAEILERGETLPPPQVFKNADIDMYQIRSGFLTIHAALKAGLVTIEVELVEKKTNVENFVGALTSNLNHGLRLSHKDKRQNTEKLLEYKEVQNWSSIRIAKLVGLSDKTVEKIRKKMSSSETPGIEKRIGIRNGRTVEWTVPNKSKKSPEDRDENADSTSTTKDVKKSNPVLEKNQNTNLDENSISIRRQLLTPMKDLQKKFVSFNKVFDLINDGDEPITKKFIANFIELIEGIHSSTDQILSLTIDSGEQK